MKFKYTSVLLASVLFSGQVFADSAKGLEIASERKARDTGWQDSIATMSMVLQNAQGESSSRLMRLKSLEIDGDGDKGLTILTNPAM